MNNAEQSNFKPSIDAHEKSRQPNTVKRMRHHLGLNQLVMNSMSKLRLSEQVNKTRKGI